MTREEAIRELNTFKIGAKSELGETALDVAIKTLEKKPCEYAISRQAVLDMATTIQTDDYSGNEIMEVVDTDDIKALPPVTPAPKKDVWIPCSERLPEPKETENLIAKYYLVQNEYGDMMVARWDGNGWEQMYQHEYLEDDVIAWMPLPEKYKTEMESESKWQDI